MEHRTMKTRLLAAITCHALVASCKKGDDNAAPSGGGGADTTGNNGSGLVTGWSPVKPYPMDAITLTGGPFNTGIAQNSAFVPGDAFDVRSPWAERNIRARI